ncbi:MAG: metalloprotease TldD [Pseudomonadota bacterium]
MTDATLETARRTLLAPSGLDETRLEQLLGGMLDRQVDYADVYLQASRSEGWSLEDGMVKDASHSIDHGAGLRAVSAEKTGFAYSDEIAPKALEQAGRAARAIAAAGDAGAVQAWRSPERPQLYVPVDPLDTLSDDAKVALLEDIDKRTRALDPRVRQVMVSLSGELETMLVAATDGTLAADVRPLVRFNVTVIAESDGRREVGSAGGGGRFGYDYFVTDDRAMDYARRAVEQALVNLEAEEAPAGTMTVVLGPGWPGVLLHEAIGHGLEGDFNRKKTSAFAGRLGEQVASPLCTVVDQGNIPDRRGSLNVDDEGTPTGETVLIEKGILRAYMQDKMNARLMGMKPTGNGRRESFAHVPMPRMTNTFMLAGEHDPEEILASVDRGLYASNFGGGQVDITSGKFVFSASEAWLIEDGKLTRPVKGATLIGNGPDVLTRVSMVGNDMALDRGVGVCGKEGQSVPVGVGQPTLKIDGLTVGGTG